MKHLHTFDGFLNEVAKPYVDPHVAIAQNIAATYAKIADLKKLILDKPEQRDFTMAKIQVELEKIDMLQAKKNMLAAKDMEEQRKEQEKMEKLRDKAAAARQKERSK